MGKLVLITGKLFCGYKFAALVVMDKLGVANGAKANCSVHLLVKFAAVLVYVLLLAENAFRERERQVQKNFSKSR